MRKFLPADNYKVIKPVRKTAKSAGYDICCPYDIFIAPFTFTVVPTNVKAVVNNDEFVMIVPRSSLYKKHRLIMVNSFGVIDADYAGNPANDGNIGAILYNNSSEPQIIEKDEPFVQAIIVKYLITDDDEAAGERVGGFGSTDKK